MLGDANVQFFKNGSITLPCSFKHAERAVPEGFVKNIHFFTFGR